MGLKKILAGMLCMLCSATCHASVDIITYHEVDNYPVDTKDTWAVSSANLEKHLQYFRDNDYKIISFDEYKQYCEGKLALPEKSVMLAFDDGYESFYTKAYPLLKKYKAPAMLALITSWIEQPVPAGSRPAATWEQLREMDAEGLVKMVSHTDSLHAMSVVNPQGGVGSTIENRLYLGNRYETDEEYATRLNNDFAHVQELFQEKFGHKADAVVWPYGRFSGKALELALQNGYEATFLLNGGTNEARIEDLHAAKRMIIYGNPSVDELKKMLLTKDSSMGKANFAQIDLDQLYSEDKAVLDNNLQTLTDRLYINKINAVAVQAFCDDDGDGNVESVYFANSVMPVKADVLGYVTNYLSQNGYRVFAWMPTLAVQGLAQPDGSNVVKAAEAGKEGWYKRVSPFDEQAMQKLTTLYADLGKYAYVDGVLLQDDLYLNDYEDFSVPGKQALVKKFGTADKNALDPLAWSSFKTQRLSAVAQDLIGAVRQNRPNAYSARNIYTAVVQNPEAEQWFAQNYEDYLREYDYTALMAYDRMEGAESSADFLRDLAGKVKAAEGGKEKTLIKLQAYDWQQKAWIDRQHLQDEVKVLRQEGINHIGYYPDTYYWFNKQ